MDLGLWFDLQITALFNCTCSGPEPIRKQVVGVCVKVVFIISSHGYHGNYELGQWKRKGGGKEGRKSGGRMDGGSHCNSIVLHAVMP